MSFLLQPRSGQIMCVPRMVLTLVLLACISACETIASTDQITDTPEPPRILPPWQDGHFDIHHINTGRGDAAFMVFPDGTTLLFDAGDRDVNDIGRYAPLKITEARPDGSRAPGAWIAEYIKRIAPTGRPPVVDYAVISHFDSDHYGNANTTRKLAPGGNYRLSGMAEVGNLLPIGTLIDRGYPEYDFPTDLRQYYADKEESPFHNYLAFAETFEQAGKLKREALKPGHNDQLVPLYSEQIPDFEVRNIKSNADLWTGVGASTRPLFSASDIYPGEGRFRENPLSLALRIRYGSFSYYTGGDNTGLQPPESPSWFDVETPMAQVIGGVDVMTLNHHGHRDATNANFLRALQPRVLIQQSWFSDHPGGEVVYRMLAEYLWEGPRDIFSTSMAEETKVAIGPWMVEGYASFEGHVVVRVAPGGDEYRVYVLDDTKTDLVIRSAHGPFRSR